MNIPEFVNKWKSSTLTERASAQSWFSDLCRVLGVPAPTDLDVAGDTYTFERGASKTSGGNGWADVWMRHHFAWEFKGKHADLAKAYKQLKDYEESLEKPPLLVVSDIDSIVVRTNFNNTPTQKYVIPLDELSKPANIDILRALWDDPARLRPELTSLDVTTQAANELGKVALALRDRGVEPHRAAHFTVELLFCFFAEDIGLLPRGLFSRLLEFGAKQPAAFNKELDTLLNTMRDGGFYNLQTIPRFNGGLFEEVAVEELAAEEIKALAKIGALDWEEVEPAIFGTLFERSLDPARRSQLGAHYTGVADIERVIDPVVMQPLLRRWEAVRAEADPLAAAWMEARKTGTPQKRNAAEKAFRAAIDGFLAELRAVTVLDPACGSGNFLYVALRKLMDLEKEVIEYAAAQGMSRMFPEVSPRQVLGLEISEYAVEITRTVVWIGYLQWRVMNGFGVGDPVLQPLETIREQDALLDLSDGEVKEAVWPAADFIVGNPPFLGGNKVRQELGDAYLNELFKVYDGRVLKFADLCCYFFEVAREQIDSGLTDRVGLLATNSIRGGANREVLNRIKATGDIYFAWSDEPWVLDGAAVRISIVGFDNGQELGKTLNGSTVPFINPDLTSSVDITKAEPLVENLHIAFMGQSKKGPFDVPGQLARSWLAMPLNPNGRPNSDVVRPWANGLDLTRRPRDMWLIDFGVGTPEAEAAFYEAPFEYAREHVYPVRTQNNRASYRDRWWLHAEGRPALRRALSSLDRYLATPTVAKFRTFTWLNVEVIPDQQLIAFARDDDYFFGVLHSRAHEVWSLRMGTWLGKGNDPRYTPTTCFETFPLPWPPGSEPTDDPRVIAIAAAAKELDETRRRWLDPEGASEDVLKKRTLTNLYNERPTWLRNLHAKLDRAVWDAYGWPGDEAPWEVGEEVILERLLLLNLNRTNIS